MWKTGSEVNAKINPNSGTLYAIELRRLLN